MTAFFSHGWSLPGFVDVVALKDLDRNSRFSEKHILGQIFIVPQIHSARKDDVNIALFICEC